MGEHIRAPRKSASDARFCAERRDKPLRTKDGLEVMCQALLRRVPSIPSINRVVIDAVEPGTEGFTWELAALVPQQSPAIFAAAQAAVADWRYRYDLV